MASVAELSEEKIRKFGGEFLTFLDHYCAEHNGIGRDNLQADTEKLTEKFSDSLRTLYCSLPEYVQEVYDLLVNYRKSIVSF